MIETHPALKNVVVGTYTFLYENLELICILVNNICNIYTSIK